jgi:carboxyl-terminal processing protease
MPLADLRVRFVGACLCLFAAVPTLVARPAQEWRTAALASFDEAWQTIDESYHDRTFGGLDWAGVRAELRPRVARARDADEARRVLRDMLARLGQSHFVLLSAASASEALPGDATIAIDLRAESRGIVVVSVEPDSNAAKAGVRAGDRITSIDAEDVTSWYRTAEGADERTRLVAVWQRAFRALHGANGSRARLALVDPANRPRVVDVVRARTDGQPVTLGNLPPLYVRTRVSEARTPAGRRVGVIAFNVWMTAISEPFAAAIDTYRHADGIVVDLRGNPGGLAEMMRGIAGHFLNAPELLGRMHLRTADLEFRANPRRSTSDGRRVEPFAGPLAILVDELTASTSECFTGALQSLGRARVFGIRSRGEALPAATRRLSSGDVLMYAIGDFVTSTGVRLEGGGVTPDEVVNRSLDQLADGRDRALEAALAWVDTGS